MTDRAVVIGVDGGGTHTRCLVADLSGRPLGQGEAGPSNYHAVGRARARESLQQAISRAMARASVDASQVKAACLGLSGVGRPEDEAAVRPLLDFLAPAPIRLVSDGRITLAGAFDGRPGVIVIGGTGSLVLGTNAAGDVTRAGGWGWILGDEGSGFFIGRQAVMAALAAWDMTGPETILQERILVAWGLEVITQVVPLVYGDLHAGKTRLASLAPVVLQAAADGDGVAQAILQQAGSDLGHQAAAVLFRLGLVNQAQPPRVAYTGGVLTGIDTVREALQATLRERVPGALLVPCEKSPVEGAVRLALDHLDQMWTN